MPAVNNETFELDLTKSGGLMQALYLGQGDKNGTIIKVKITDNGELPDGIAGMVPYFEMMLPDAAHYYEVAGTLSVADGEAIATITIDETKAAAVPGITDTAYIALKSGSTVIASTERLRVCVLRNAADGVDPAQAWNNGIEEAVARANAAAAAAEGVVLQAVPTMSATVKGGAKLGTGLEMSGTNSDVLQVSQALRDSIFRYGAVDCDDLNPGICFATSASTNQPSSNQGGAVLTVKNPSGTNAVQLFVLNTAASDKVLYTRRKRSGIWSEWILANQ